MYKLNLHDVIILIFVCVVFSELYISAIPGGIIWGVSGLNN